MVRPVNAVAEYLTSRRNLMGCGLALLAAGLTLLDPVGPAAAVLIAGFYALGVAAVRPDPLIARYGFDPKEVHKALQQEIADVSGRVPAEVILRMRRIEFITASQVLPRLDCLPAGSLDLYLVERTARDYLPRAVNNYLLVPAGYVSSRVPEEPMPLQVLIEELDLMEGQMRRIAAVVQRADMDRLLAHRRFLSERFSAADVSR